MNRGKLIMKKSEFDSFRPVDNHEIEEIQGGGFLAAVLVVSGVVGLTQQVVDAVRGYRDGRREGYRRNRR